MKVLSFLVASLLSLQSVAQEAVDTSDESNVFVAPTAAGELGGSAEASGPAESSERAATNAPAATNPPAVSPDGSSEAEIAASTELAALQDQVPEGSGGVKAMSGMSILGNEEAPQALVIVPWKSSQIGDEIGISNDMDGRPRPVDKEVFMREVHYYELRAASAD